MGKFMGATPQHSPRPTRSVKLGPATDDKKQFFLDAFGSMIAASVQTGGACRASSAQQTDENVFTKGTLQCRMTKTTTALGAISVARISCGKKGTQRSHR